VKSVGISRTDGLGDCILTLPLADWLHSQGYTVIWICKSWVKPALRLSPSIHYILTIEDLRNASPDAILYFASIEILLHVFPNPWIANLACQYGIPYRIGTAYRFRHWFQCTNLVFFSRKHGKTHESVLNFALWQPLAWLETLPYNFIQQLPAYKPKIQCLSQHKSEGKINNIRDKVGAYLPQTATPFVVLHWQSYQSAPMWPVKRYIELQRLLQNGGIQVIWTGNTKYTGFLEKHGLDPVWNTDKQGATSLEELIQLLQQATCVVGGSTGVLHLAASLGVFHVGLYTSQVNLNPVRWQTLGGCGCYIVQHNIADITAEKVWLEMRKYNLYEHSHYRVS
jgi:heptosyltransferase III